MCPYSIHRKCSGTSLKEYDLLVEDDSIFWQCILCDIEDLTVKFPFGLLTKMEFYNLYGVNLPSQVKILPSYEFRSKRSQIPSLDNFDSDESYVQTISSNYFDITDFSNTFSSLKRHFSLFNVDTQSLSKNFDQLCTMLSALGVSFDLLGISEIKQQTGKNFINNVNIEGYHICTQPSTSAAGGVAIYVDDKLDHFNRDDLSVLNDEFESIWVEIKNKRGKTSCVAVLSPPNTDISNCMDYLESTFSKVNQKKYQVFLLGDFG